MRVVYGLHRLKSRDGAFAQQLEAAMLQVLEKRELEAYHLLKAKPDVKLQRAGLRLQDLRVNEARSEVTLAELQRDHANLQLGHWSTLLEEGITNLRKP